ncbi:MAG: cyanophycin synthetase [Actinomycetota bacterium]
MKLSFKQAGALLNKRGFGITPGLERIAALMDMLDHPELKYPTIHIAGTNAKTSTGRILAAVLASHGLKTGLYTSPHLSSITERYGLAGWDDGLMFDAMSEEDFAFTLAYLLPFVELVENDRDESLTYFELTTAVAFEWMLEKSVGAGIVESGMGGRWDATNLVDSAVSILTPIDVDHQQFLGNSPAASAAEKVEIIKPASTVVTARQHPEVAEQVAAKGAAVGARVIGLGEQLHLEVNDTAVGGRLIGVRTSEASYEELFLPLHGAHQGANLALAIAAAEALLNQELDHDLLRAALLSVTSPGRLEVLGRHPLVVVDGAHNPSAAAALVATLPHDFAYERLTLVLTVFEDKDVEGILAPLASVAGRIILTRSDSARAAAPVRLRQALPPSAVEPEIVDNLEEAVDLAVASSLDDEMVLVTGSLFGIGQARQHLLNGAGGAASDPRQS